MGSRTGLLGEFEHMVLVAILRLGEGAYGAAILDEIERRTGRDTSAGSLYVTLDRLESKGYIESRAGDPSPGRGGRSRRYVSVTAAGFEAVRESRAALMGLWKGLETRFEER